MGRVSLIIVYNHQYNENIDFLERLYRDRFSNIHHLVPFFEGQRHNVIPVYESSHYFQGYVAQGLQHFFDPDVDHYIFVADDLFLNPAIDENNYGSYFHIDRQTCFLPCFTKLHKCDGYWPRCAEALDWDPGNRPGVEILSQLPTYASALDSFKKFDLEIRPIEHWQAHKTRPHKNWWRRTWWRRRAQRSAYKAEYELKYPLIGGYSDIFVVNHASIRQFARLCGIFSAAKLFVELAVPTAMVMAAEAVTTEEDTRLKGRALWNEEDLEILEPYGKSIKSLTSNFPIAHLYLHPVKLSQWNFDV